MTGGSPAELELRSPLELLELPELPELEPDSESLEFLHEMYEYKEAMQNPGKKYSGWTMAHMYMGRECAENAGVPAGARRP